MFRYANRRTTAKNQTKKKPHGKNFDHLLRSGSFWIFWRQSSSFYRPLLGLFAFKHWATYIHTYTLIHFPLDPLEDRRMVDFWLRLCVCVAIHQQPRGSQKKRSISFNGAACLLMCECVCECVRVSCATDASFSPKNPFSSHGPSLLTEWLTHRKRKRSQFHSIPFFFFAF